MKVSGDHLHIVSDNMGKLSAKCQACECEARDLLKEVKLTFLCLLFKMTKCDNLRLSGYVKDLTEIALLEFAT